jgi:23S rRNA (pseudouridine1915-N3)-methyltransferase
MKWQIAVVGKPALAYARAGMDEYLKRLQRCASAEVLILKSSDMDRAGSRLAKLREGALLIALDQRGEHWSTEKFRDTVDKWENDGAIKRIVLFIGGADGHDAEMRETADVVLSLSHFTLQHELALVVFLEQLYRVYTIKRGEPYHH